jgi:hypothetical protein
MRGGLGDGILSICLFFRYLMSGVLKYGKSRPVDTNDTLRIVYIGKQL